MTDLAPIAIDAEAWRQYGGRRPFQFTHDLVGDPRLTHEAIVDLTLRLPRDVVEMNRPDLPDVLASDAVPELDRDPVELVRDLVELRRWVALHNIEIDAVYRRLVAECLDPLATIIGEFEGGMTSGEGYLFLSPSEATTPAHLDYEHNIFLQIEGTKEITVGFVEPETEARALESMHGGGYGRLPTLPDELETYRLEPGDGMYISPSLVHMIHTQGDELSISLSLVFHTPTLDRGARVHAANHDLRRLGLSPRPPGLSRSRDAAKSGSVLVWRWLKGHLPGSSDG